STVGRRAARPGTVPHRATALLHPQSQHRDRGPAAGTALRDRHVGLGPAGSGHADRPRAQGPADRPVARGHAVLHRVPQRATSRRRRTAHSAGRRSRTAVDPSGHGLRDRASGREHRAARGAHDGTARRPARRYRRHPVRRRSRPHRRDRPAGYRRRRPARPGLPAPCLADAESAPPQRPGTRRRLKTRNPMSHLQHPLGTGITAAATADDVLAGIDLTGTNAVVTGGHRGIGREVTRALAAAGARVTVGARDPDQAELWPTSTVPVEVRRLDLLDPASIDHFAAEWLDGDRALHMLINSAGLPGPPELVHDARGYEVQFATNHLGHFQLTLALWPALRAANGARVVNVSSGAQ